MKPQWAGNPRFVAQFTREADAAAQLVHHHLVEIYDFGDRGGTPYFSTEWVEGESLAARYRRDQPLPADEAAVYVLQAVRGLKYAHDQGMVHRDVNLENLFVSGEGVVKVTNLGLVKTPELAEAEESANARTSTTALAGASQVTHAKVAVGTPAYMAPEQAEDAVHIDARADIYSLGCTLYALITGRPPFEGKTVVEIQNKHKTQPVTPPELIVKRVSRDLSAIVMKMLARNRDERYSDLGDVMSALEVFLGVPSAGAFTPRQEHANLLAEMRP